MQENKCVRAIQPFKNLYCDAFSCALGQFYSFSPADEKELSREDKLLLCEFAVVKNKMAGVKELQIKVPEFNMALDALEKHGISGREILPALAMNTLPSKALVGDKVMLEIDALSNYNDPFLSDLSNFLGRTQVPVLINLGRDLEEVGKIVNKFNCSPAEVLESYGFLDRKCFIYGMNNIDKDDQLLFQGYAPKVILSPRSDAEEGKGGINLYNLIYNEIDFAFASGKCYNIDMLSEGKLAMQNTANLMFQPDLIKVNKILDALSAEGKKIEVEFDGDEREENLLDKKVELNCNEYETLKEKVKQIAKRLKEKKQ